MTQKRKPHSEETKRKIGLANSTKRRTPEQNEVNRQWHLGKTPWNKGLTKETDERVMKHAITLTGRKLSEYHIMKVKLGHLDYSGKNHPFYGKHHSEKTKKLRSEQEKAKWNNSEYKDKRVKAILNGLIKRPTSYEKKISELCIDYKLPFAYTGNGTFLIGHRNPDFVCNRFKIAIEVYHTYFKIRDFGSCEDYEKKRGEYFLKYGYKTIFIRTEEIEDVNWKDICLNKIKDSLGDKNAHI